MRARDAILDLFDLNKELTIKEIVDRTDFSKQMAHYAINQLMEAKMIERVGHRPKTIYRRLQPTLPATQLQRLHNFTDADIALLDDNFLIVTETGKLLQGVAAFQHWCWQRSLRPDPTFLEYKLTRDRYAGYYDSNGFIDALGKLKNTKGYDKIWLDQFYYLDFYAIERFGMTRIGSLVNHAKQGQNRFLMRILTESIINQLNFFLEEMEADAVGFIPPTIPREIQLMKFLQTHLDIYLPEVKIRKITDIVPVAQSSLSKLDERIKNAENSYAVTDLRRFNHLVLIDDAAFSGATLNQVAAKIRIKGIAGKVTGLAVVGSPKGMDVIADK
ncbi:MAG TPA: hypothetical protein VG101_19325 [Puia sp.]|jgi:hypothetical protein|nr:hypothetical protein [Puia sp.]